MSTLNIKGRLPISVQSPVPKGLYAPILDFSTAQDMRYWESINRVLPSGRYIDCRSYTNQYTSNTLSDVFETLISYSNAKLIRVENTNGNYTGGICSTGSTRCVQLTPCSSSLIHELTSRNTYVDVYSIVSESDSKRIFEMTRSDDATFSRSSMIDSFVEVVWDNGVATATRRGSTHYYGEVHHPDEQRPLKIFQSDVSWAASVNHRQFDIAPQTLKVIPLGYPTPFSIDVNGAPVNTVLHPYGYMGLAHPTNLTSGSHF